MKPLVLAGLLVFVVAPVEADKLTAGLGANTCPTFISDLKTDPKIETEYYKWAVAFMSGINVMMLSLKSNTADLEFVSAAQTTSFMREYCETNPSSWVADAASYFWASLPVRPKK
jgi:hypothetical protein